MKGLFSSNGPVKEEKMKGVILATVLIVGLAAGQVFAQMGQGHMSGTGMMGQGGQSMMDQAGQSMMGGQNQQPAGQNPDSGGHYPCQMHQGMGPGMMGGQMGGYGMMGGHMGGHMGQGHMGGDGMMGTGHNSETYQKNQDEYNKYLDDTAGIRKNIHNKKFEYFEAVRNPNTTRTDILKIEKELHDLKWQLYEKAPR